MKKVFILCCVFGVSFLCAEKRREKFLQVDQHTKAAETEEYESVRLVAKKLIQEKIQREADKLEEKRRLLLEEMQKKAKELEVQLARKREAKKQRFLQKAALEEKMRRRNIRAWRDQWSKKKAAACLERQVARIDITNKLHVKELKQEIQIFFKDRLRHKTKSYPTLVAFVSE